MFVYLWKYMNTIFRDSQHASNTTPGNKRRSSPGLIWGFLGAIFENLWEWDRQSVHTQVARLKTAAIGLRGIASPSSQACIRQRVPLSKQWDFGAACASAHERIRWRLNHQVIRNKAPVTAGHTVCFCSDKIWKYLGELAMPRYSVNVIDVSVNVFPNCSVRLKSKHGFETSCNTRAVSL